MGLAPVAICFASTTHIAGPWALCSVTHSRCNMGGITNSAPADRTSPDARQGKKGRWTCQVPSFEEACGEDHVVVPPSSLVETLSVAPADEASADTDVYHESPASGNVVSVVKRMVESNVEKEEKKAAILRQQIERARLLEQNPPKRTFWTDRAASTPTLQC